MQRSFVSPHKAPLFVVLLRVEWDAVLRFVFNKRHPKEMLEVKVHVNLAKKPLTSGLSRLVTFEVEELSHAQIWIA